VLDKIQHLFFIEGEIMVKRITPLKGGAFAPLNYFYKTKILE